MYPETSQLIRKWLESAPNLIVFLDAAPAYALAEFLELVGEDFEKKLSPRAKRIMLIQKLTLPHLENAKQVVMEIIKKLDPSRAI